MELVKNRSFVLLALLVAVVAVVATVFWLNQGYGEVSPQTYQYSKALYIACLSKNEAQLEKIQEMIQSEKAQAMPDTERQWIEAIVSQAEQGQWKDAAKQAKRMMKDQVKY